MPAYLPNQDDWIIQGGELRLYEEGGASLEMQWDHVSDDRTLEVWVSRPEPQLSMDDLAAQKRSEGEVVVGEGTMNGFPALHTRYGSADISYWWDGDASVRVRVFGSDLPDEAVVVNLTRHEVTDESVQALLDGNGVCEPDSTVVDPLIGPEAQARTQDDVEVWALFFLTFPIRPNGDPISIPVSTEIKIVWSVTGTGDFRIEAVGPNGASIESIWEPTGHLGSSWERPGDEWDTSWTFPEVGCWTFEIQRGDSAAQLSIDVHEGDR
jgi:hypothetical protein